MFHNDDVTSKFKPKNVDMTFIKEFVGKRALSNEDQVSQVIGDLAQLYANKVWVFGASIEKVKDTIWMLNAFIYFILDSLNS